MLGRPLSKGYRTEVGVVYAGGDEIDSSKPDERPIFGLPREDAR